MKTFENKLQIQSEDIKLFAVAACDPNPIHQDNEIAKQMGLEGAIAHGMYLYCYLMRRLDDWMLQEKNSGRNWSVKNTKCRFYDPALVGKSFETFLELGETVESKLKVNLVMMSGGKKVCVVTAQLESV